MCEEEEDGGEGREDPGWIPGVTSLTLCTLKNISVRAVRSAAPAAVPSAPEPAWVCITIRAYVNTALPPIAPLLRLSPSFGTIVLEDTGFNGILPIPFPPLSLELQVNSYIKTRKTLQLFLEQSQAVGKLAPAR